MCVAPGRPTGGPDWRQQRLGQLTAAPCPERAAGELVLLFLNLLLHNSEHVAMSQRHRLSLSSEHLAALRVTKPAREPPASPGAGPDPACLRSLFQPRAHPRRTSSSPRPGSLPLGEEGAFSFCCKTTNKTKLTLSILMIPDGFIKCKYSSKNTNGALPVISC